MKRFTVFAIIIAIALSPLFRGLFFSLEASLVLTIIAILSVIYFLYKLAKKETVHFNKRLVLLGLLLIVAYILSFAQAVSVRANINTLIQLIEYLVVSIILVDYFHDRKQQFSWLLMLSVVISGFINAVIGIEAFSGAFSNLIITLHDTRVGATFQYANTSAVYFVVCLIFSVSLINQFNKVYAKLVFFGLGNIAFLAMLLTGSRGGYIVAFLILIVFFLIQPSKFKLSTLGSIICSILPAFIFLSRISSLYKSNDYMSITKLMLLSFAAAILLGLFYEMFKRALMLIKPKLIKASLVFLILAVIIVIGIQIKGSASLIPENIINRIISLNFNDESFVARVNMDRWAIKLIADNWVIGHGGGAWDSLYQSVQEISFMARTPHNNYMQVFIESGILGFLSYLGIIILSLWFMLSSLIKTNELKNKLFITGLFCGFLAFVIHSSFDFDLTFISLALFFWVFIASSAIFLPDRPDTTGKKNNNILHTSSKTIQFGLVVLCSLLLSFNGLYSAAAYYADSGYNHMVIKDYQSAQASYEQASRLDPINPVYPYQLTKIYNYYAAVSKNPGYVEDWREMARTEAEKAIALDAFYPDYRAILSVICIDSNLPVEALDNAEKLIKYQPCNSNNYEILARAYFEAGKYYIENGNQSKGKELLLLCSNIDKNQYAKKSDILSSYKEQALTLLNNID